MQLQMPNIRQASGQPVQNTQNLPGLPPLPLNKPQSGLPHAHENRASTGVPRQYGGLQFSAQSQVQHSLVPSQVLQQGELLTQPGIPYLPSNHTQSSGGLSVGPHVHLTISSSLNK